MEKINFLLEEIVRIALANAPPRNGAQSFTIEALTLRMITELNAFYTNEDGRQISFNPKIQVIYDPKTDLTSLFRELRKEMYDLSPHMGAWLTCRLTAETTGKFKAVYDYEHQPEFADDIVDEFYIDDFKHFPRERNQIPAWFEEILRRTAL